MKLVVGIGNPEARYERTRHNAGFRVLDRLCGPGTGWSDRPGALQGRLEHSRVSALDEGTLLVRPLTYVNRSGLALEELRKVLGARWAPGKVLAVCDDVNLDFGKLRLRASGSAGGHHGLESMIASLGTEEFPRLRFGVRTEGMPADLTAYVLERFSSEEEKGIDSLIDKAAEVCRVWTRDGFEAAMNRLGQLQSVK